MVRFCSYRAVSVLISRSDASLELVEEPTLASSPDVNSNIDEKSDISSDAETLVATEPFESVSNTGTFPSRNERSSY